MSVSWEDNSSPARMKAHAAAMVSGEFDNTVPTWDIYCDLREALIWALLVTGFPTKSGWEITERNWKQVYARLCVLEQVNGCYRIYNNGDQLPRSVWFTPEEIRSMVGLHVNAGNKSDAEFKTYIFGKLMEKADANLRDLGESYEDEYQYEINRYKAVRKLRRFPVKNWDKPEESQDDIHNHENRVLDTQ